MPSEGSSLLAVAVVLGRIAHRAGGVIVDTMRLGLTRLLKDDDSPCTNADLAAEASILVGLAEAFPGIPIVTEETLGGRDPGDGRFFLVDPLDGTRDFLGGRSEFTVNIALIDRQRPVAGAIYAPLLDRLWVGGETSQTCVVSPLGAIAEGGWRPSRTRRAPEGGLVGLESVSHRDPATERFLGRLTVKDRRQMSSSLKFCTIADGEADVYPRFGPTMEWDTAAGEAILRAAGGLVTRPSGEPIRYGAFERGFRNDAFIAWGDAEYARRFLTETDAGPAAR